MDKANLISKLNEAVSLELTGLIQYNHNSHVILGQDRMIWSEFFEEQADEALDHVRKFSERIVALGGTPSHEPAEIHLASRVDEMLRNAYEHEMTAVRVYTEALDYVGNSVAYRTLLEDHIQSETQDAEEIAMFLGEIEKVGAASPKRKARMA